MDIKKKGKNIILIIEIESMKEINNTIMITQKKDKDITLNIGLYMVINTLKNEVLTMNIN